MYDPHAGIDPVAHRALELALQAAGPVGVGYSDDDDLALLRRAKTFQRFLSDKPVQTETLGVEPAE